VPFPEYYSSERNISERNKGRIDRSYLLELASRIEALHFTGFVSAIFGTIAGTIVGAIAGVLSQEPSTGAIVEPIATATSLMRSKEAMFVIIKGTKYLRILHSMATPKLVSIRSK
jgi:hypothetical protein